MNAPAAIDRSRFLPLATILHLLQVGIGPIAKSPAVKQRTHKPNRAEELGRSCWLLVSEAKAKTVEGEGRLCLWDVC